MLGERDSATFLFFFFFINVARGGASGKRGGTLVVAEPEGADRPGRKGICSGITFLKNFFKDFRPWAKLHCSVRIWVLVVPAPPSLAGILAIWAVPQPLAALPWLCGGPWSSPLWRLTLDVPDLSFSKFPGSLGTAVEKGQVSPCFWLSMGTSPRTVEFPTGSLTFLVT